jgi:hypothetical protein
MKETIQAVRAIWDNRQNGTPLQDKRSGHGLAPYEPESLAYSLGLLPSQTARRGLRPSTAPAAARRPW